MINPPENTKKHPVINSTMSYFELCTAIGGTTAEIPAGNNLIDNNEPLMALSVVQDSKDKEKFAIIFSISHVIVDGFTY